MHCDSSLLCLRAAKTVPSYTLQQGDDDDDGLADEALIDQSHSNDQKKHHLQCDPSKCSDCDYISSTSKDIFDVSRSNLLPVETRYLRWHAKLGHRNFASMKRLSEVGYLPRFISQLEEAPVCLGCRLGKATKVRRQKGKIIGDSIKVPGDLLHVDQVECRQPGRPMTFSGHNSSTKVTCFSIFVDSISKKIWTEFQTSTDADQTLQGKHRVEKNAAQFNVTVKAYRGDNGVFRSKEFQDDIDKNNQFISFCGVGAHSQNSVAEHHIHTIVEKARAMLLTASSKWPEVISVELWTFAVNYAVHIWNHTPREDLNFQCPEAVFSGIKFQSKDEMRHIIKNFHPFGCPVYVLDSRIQDGKKPPRWDPRSRTGVFLGHSSQHSNSVSLILNPTTDRISPQYHCLFDDNFHTISTNLESDKIAIWDDVHKTDNQTDSLVDFKFPDFLSTSQTSNDAFTDNFHSSTTSRSLPKSSGTPLTLEISESTINRRGSNVRRAQIVPSIHETTDQSSPQRESSVDADKPSSNVCDSPSQTDDSSTSSGDQDLTARSSQSTKHLKPVSSRKRTVRGKRYKIDCLKPRDGAGPRKSKRSRRPPSKLRAALSEVKDFAAKLQEAQKRHGKPFTFEEKVHKLMEMSSLPNGEINDTSPHLLAASVNPNILGHAEAMRAHDADKFREAMDEEMLRMIENEIYEEVPKHLVPKTHNILRAVWSHRRKTDPAGNVYRHRSRLCIDGSRQQAGIDYTEMYSPVVSWTTIRVLLILSVLLDLRTRAVDYVQAFPQAKLDESEAVYMQIPPGYKTTRKDTCLKLKRNLYGLKQASYNWHNLLKSGLLKLGFQQSEHEPCLFLKESIICVVYVDDTVFFAKDDAVIDRHISELRKLDFELTEEGEVTQFLGIEIHKDANGVITVTQKGLIDAILTLLQLKDESKQHKTPAVSPPLHSDEQGPEREMTWNYRSAIGMLIYLARNTRPDIKYAVHQCARFQINPKKSHENAVKRIGQYLPGTRNKGIIFKPDPNKLGALECFVDADFAGNYTKDRSYDPNSVRSRTGCVILFAGCPITWFSQLQSEISLSTTEAEYIALSTACRELLPMKEMFKELKSYLNILDLTPDVKCTLFEDNVGAEMLAKAPKMTPRTKHIAIKYHHFREAVKSGVLNITRVDTNNQLADVFTKAVKLHTFEHLRENIMGWLTIFHQKNINQTKDKQFENFANHCMKEMHDI